MYFFSKKIRRVELYTAPDILGHFYNDLARFLGSITIIVAYTAIVAYQFRAGGIVLELVTDLPYERGVLLTAIFVITYTSVAGMISVAYTDIINGWLIIITSVISLIVLTINGGGWHHIIAQIQQSDPQKLTIFGHINFIEVLGYFIPTLALLLGEASMYQKFFSAKNERHVKMATLGWIIGTIIVESVFVLMAFISSSMYSLEDLNNRPESIILYTARHAMPVLFGSLLLAGSVAILLSTADAFLLAPATSFVKDIYQKYFRKKAKQDELVFISRISVILLGILAYIQISFFKSVLSMAMYAYTMYGASLTPAILAALLMKKVNPVAATSSIIVGMLSTMFFEYYSILTGYKILNLPTVIPALILSVSTLLILNTLMRKKDITY
jgi:SSS family solute:Na+ symporter/sodium/proline symporter